MNKYNVLIADDNKANQLIAGRFLNQLGIETSFAKDGEEALTIIADLMPNLVLMDLNMPVLNGFDACKMVRDKEEDYFKNVPIIAVTSSFAEDVKAQMNEYGLTDFIPKPINPVTVKKMVEKYLPVVLEDEENGNEKLICACKDMKFDCTRLFEITNGNLSMVKDIIKTIVDILPEELNAISTAMSNNEFDKVRMSAHKIKPNYEYVGLVQLADVAERIEESAGRIQASALEDLVKNLSEKTNQVLPLLSTCELKEVH